MQASDTTIVDKLTPIRGMPLPYFLTVGPKLIYWLCSYSPLVCLLSVYPACFFVVQHAR